MANKYEEQELQKQIREMLDSVLCDGVFVFAIPNGGQRNKKEAAIMKACRLVDRGVPDVCIIAAGKAYFLEIKCRTGKVSSAQHDTMSALEHAGADCAVVRSVDKALAMVLFWGIPNRIAASERERLSRIGYGVT